MWEELRRFSKLDAPGRALFLRAAALLPFVSACLRMRGFRKTQAFLQKRFSGKDSATGLSPDTIELTARMVRSAVRHGFGHATCLEESLVLWSLLGGQGIASELRIGVRKSENKFEAHAWVEREGRALNEPEAAHQHYASFDVALSSFPQEPR